MNKFLYILSVFVLSHSFSASAVEIDAATRVRAKKVFTTPIEWIDAKPAEQESVELLSAIKAFETNGIGAGFSALEQFLGKFPKSSWSGSLHCHLAERCRIAGQFTSALEHWRQAWELSKNKPDEKSKKVASRTISGLTSLLASLGRIEELDDLFKQAKERNLDVSAFASLLNGTHEGLEMMKTKPSVSYRCGTFALCHLMKELQATNATWRSIMQIPSPKEGFSMARLVEVAETNGLKLTPAFRPPGTEIVVPSIVHWKLDHYAAILKKSGTSYLVADPTFGKESWFDEGTINSEASGHFLVATRTIPATWQEMSSLEASKIHGKGGPNAFEDWLEAFTDPFGVNDDDCPTDPPGPGDGAGAGEGDDDCPDDEGMAIWRVSEPHISLWLQDSPLFYRMTSGKKNRLRVFYRHRAVAKDDSVAGFGDRWDFNWLETIEKESTNSTLLKMSLPGGAVSYIYTNGAAEYKSAQRWVTNSVDHFVACPYGETKKYGLVEYFLAGAEKYYMTEFIDRYGRTNTFSYDLYTNIDSSIIIRLRSVTDIDGLTCTINYTNSSYPNLITSVVDPYGRSATFTYNGSKQLAAITDMAGLNSIFTYGTNGFVTNLNTAYGNTGFKFYEGSNSVCALNRAIEVTELNLAKQLFVYRDIASPEIMGNFFTSDPFYTNRNSFHWNRQQYAVISVAGKTNYLEMETEDYRNASVKHWLHGDWLGDHGTVVDTLGGSAGPVVDKTGDDRIDGVLYTYYGQVDPWFIGSLRKISGIFNQFEDQTLFERNEWGRPTQISYYRNGSLATYTNVFDADGRILQKVWGPEGELVRGYGYDVVRTNLLTSVTNAVGDVLRFTHDTNAKVTSILRPTGLLITNLYYSNGFLKSRIEVGFSTNSYAYTNGNKMIRTNALGLVVVYSYDNLNRLTTVTYPDTTTESYSYSKLDMVGTKDRADNWTYFGYNNVRQMTSRTNANGQVTQFDYCDCGALNSITAWNGASSHVTRFTNDIAGRVTVRIEPDGYAITNVYHPYASRILRTIDSSGRVTSFGYGNYAFVTSVGLSQLPTTSPDGYLLQRSVDKYGRVVRIQNRNGVTVTNGYDVLGRVVTRSKGDAFTNPSGIQTNSYSARGLTKFVDALGHTNSLGYDVKGRLISETNANGDVLTFAYNAADEMLTLTDGKNQTTLWHYDEYGRVTNKVDAANQVVFTFGYDLLDRVTSRQTPATGITYYGYDVLGNLTNIDYPGVGMDVTYKYDQIGRLTNMTDAIGTTVFGYTAAHQLAFEDGPWDCDTVTYSYDNQRRSNISLLQSHAAPWIQAYEYDGYARMTATTSPVGRFEYSYLDGISDHIGRVTYPTGETAVDNEYDAFARLTNAVHSTALYPVIDRFSYQYNAGDQRVRQVFREGNYIDYAYDRIGQLKAATGIEANGLTLRLHEQFGYNYDAASNLAARTNNSFVQSFSTDSVNQLSSASRSGTLTLVGSVWGPFVSVSINGSTNSVDVYGDGMFSKAGIALTNGENAFSAEAIDSYGRTDNHHITVNMPATVVYQYDGNGNLTNDGLRSFEYDGENQATNIYVGGDWRSVFRYDGLNRRREKIDYKWVGTWLRTKVTRYIYDRGLVIQERNENNIAITTYTRGLDVSSSSLSGSGGVGGLLARTDNVGMANAYYHCDGNGNVTALTDIHGGLLARYAYDPFGRIIVAVGPLARLNSYRFASKEYDDISGLSYYLYRFYDPNLQRWINRDPIEEFGGLNLYGFVRNRPVSFVDRWGLCGDPWFDELGDWIRDHVDESKEISDENLPWWLAGAADTALDLGGGLGTLPEKLGHFGEGSGRFAGDPTLENSAGLFDDISTAASVGAAAAGAVRGGGLPDEAWHRNAPRQVTPGVRQMEQFKYNPKTGQLERSSVHYDQYGRQIERTDYTDHGYPENHENPHHHSTEYGRGYGPKGKESGPKPGPCPCDK